MNQQFGLSHKRDATLREVEDILERLRNCVDDLAHGPGFERRPPVFCSPDQRPMQLAALLLKAREARASLLNGIADRDASWNILLDLFLQHSRGHPVSVGSACIASATAQTTGLRHLDALVEAGVVRRLRDPDDRRRFHLELSAEANRAIGEHLASVANMVWPSSASVRENRGFKGPEGGA